jgi:hypothetical protein
MTSKGHSWTIYTASKHFDLHHKRLRAILASAGRLPSGHEALSANSVEIGGADVDRFLADIAEMMSLTKAREYLNIPRPHDRLLFEAGYLVPFVVGGTDLVKDHGLRKTDLDAFMTSLHSPATAAVTEGMVPIPAAAKRTNCSAVEIVELITSRRLTKVALDANERGYMAILVDPAEIAPLVRLPDHGCLSMREVERTAQWSTAVVTALVDGGHLKTQMVRNPTKRSLQTVVHPATLAEFQASYVSLSRLADELGIHFLKLKQQLEDAAIQPASGLENVPVTFYLRQSLRDFTPGHG